VDMKTKMLLFILLSAIIGLFSEILVIHKTDGSSIQFPTNNIIDLTFEAEESEVIQIHKTDETTDVIEIALVENIEFTELEPVTMLINRIDGIIYEIETDLIADITFGGFSSLEDASELINSIPIRLLKNIPNPFNPNTSICFELYEAGFTKISLNSPIIALNRINNNIFVFISTPALNIYSIFLLGKSCLS